MNVESPLFAEQFEALRPSLPDGDAEWRQVAFDRFAALGLPSQKREAWRYTPLSALRNELAHAPWMVKASTRQWKAKR